MAGEQFAAAVFATLESGLPVLAGARVDLPQHEQGLAHAARAGLHIGVERVQEAAQVGGALPAGRPVRQPDRHRDDQQHGNGREPPPRHAAGRPPLLRTGMKGGSVLAVCI